MTTEPTIERRPPPYAPYRSWKNLIEKLKGRRPLPVPFDSGFWNSLGFSGGLVNVLRPSMVALGLLDAGLAPTERLEDLFEASGTDLQAKYREMLDAAFPDWSQRFDIERVTSGQLTGYFSDLGVTGDTALKCRSFFLGLAGDAGLTISPHLSTRSSTGTTTRTRRSRTPSNDGQGDQSGVTQQKRRTPRQPATDSTNAQEETIKLASGGTLTIVLDANVFRLSTEDEKFVLDIMHRVRDYKNPASEPSHTSEPQDGNS